MIVDAVRLLTAWLADPDTGINAQLPGVPRAPGEDAPGAVTLYNEIDHPWVARGEIPRELMLDGSGDPRHMLLVRMHPDPQGFVAQLLPEFEDEHHAVIPLVAVFACRKVERAGSKRTHADQVRDGRQTVRTCMRVVAQRFESAHTAFEVNNVVFSLPERGGVTLNSQLVEPTDDLVFDTMVLPLRAQDRWALGLV